MIFFVARSFALWQRSLTSECSFIAVVLGDNVVATSKPLRLPRMTVASVRRKLLLYFYHQLRRRGCSGSSILVGVAAVIGLRSSKVTGHTQPLHEAGYRIVGRQLSHRHHQQQYQTELRRLCRQLNAFPLPISLARFSFSDAAADQRLAS